MFGRVEFIALTVKQLSDAKSLKRAKHRFRILAGNGDKNV